MDRTDCASVVAVEIAILEIDTVEIIISNILVESIEYVKSHVHLRVYGICLFAIYNIFYPTFHRSNV